MSVKLKRSEEREQIRTAAEKLKHCLIFLRELFYVTIINVLFSLLILPIITGAVPAMKPEATAIFAPQDCRWKITVAFDRRRFCVPKFRH